MESLLFATSEKINHLVKFNFVFQLNRGFLIAFFLFFVVGAWSHLTD